MTDKITSVKMVTKLPTKKQMEALSKEELIALLQSQQEKGKKLLKENRRLTSKYDNAVKKQEKLEKKQKELVAKSEEYKAKYEGAVNAFLTGRDHMNARLAELNRSVILLDDALSLGLERALLAMFEEFLAWIEKNKVLLSQTDFGGKGRDVPDLKKGDLTPEREQAILSDIKKLSGSHNNNRRALKRLISNMASLEEVSPEELADLRPELKELINILGMARKRKSPPKKKSRGRVAKKRPIDNKVEGKIEPGKCPNCKDGKLEYLADYVQRLISDARNIEEGLKNVEIRQRIMVCTKCLHLSVELPKGADHPVLPNRTIGVSILVNAMSSLWHGMPLERFSKDLKINQELGNDTLSYNLHDFTRWYLKPLYDSLYAELKKEGVLVMDETPFYVLQDQGRGHLSQKQQEEMTAAGDEAVRSKNYILAVSTPANAKRKLIWYHYIKTRSYQNLKELITPDFEFRTLISDGYQSYFKLVKEYGRKIQCCLIHFRRKVLRACTPVEFASTTAGMDDQTLHDYLLKNLKEGSKGMLCLGVYTDISLVYDLEASIDYEAENWQDDLLKARAEEQKLLDNLDKLMQTMAADEVTQDPNRTDHWQMKKNTRYAEAAVFYLNHRQELRHFLKDPYVTPDSNVVEGRLRVITLIRKAMDHKQNGDYAQDLAMIYSLLGTCKLNGIDARRYITDYSRALYSYCLEKHFNKCYRDPKLNWDPKENSYLQGWSFNEGNITEGFDFSAWSLTNQDILSRYQIKSKLAV